MDEFLLDSDSGLLFLNNDRYWALRYRRGQVLLVLALNEPNFINRDDIAEIIFGETIYWRVSPAHAVGVEVNTLRRELKGTGYSIESKAKVGYRLVKV